MVAGVQGDRFEMQTGVKVRQNVSGFQSYMDTGLHPLGETGRGTDGTDFVITVWHEREVFF